MTDTPSIANLTQAPITLLLPGGDTITLPSIGVAYVERGLEHAEPLGRIPAIRISMGRCHNLPDYRPGIYLLVRPEVAEAAYHAGRSITDLLVTGEEQYREGRLEGYRSVCHWQPIMSRRHTLESIAISVQTRAVRELDMRRPVRVTEMRMVAVLDLAETLLLGLAEPALCGDQLNRAVREVGQLAIGTLLHTLSDMAARARARPIAADAERQARSVKETLK